MKRILLTSILLIFTVINVFSDKIAILITGEQVILHSDGTWEYDYSDDDDEGDIPETKWTASVKTDPIDDSRIINYVLYADSGTSSWGDKIALVIRDTDGEYDLFINWQEYLGSDITVTHRVNAMESQSQEWSLSTDSQASFYLNYAYPPLKELLKQLIEAEKFVARCTPYGESPITAVFDVRGLKEMFEQYGSVLPE